MTALLIEGAEVILPDRVERVSVRVEAGRLALDAPRDGARVLDGRGLLLAPALIDIHGDAFERQIMPRPGVFTPMEVAVFETDRQLVGNGIATAYHALTLSWEPGLRSVARGEAMLAALADLAPRLAAENRVQLRWETFCFEAMEVIERALDGALLPSIAFNDHTSMAVLHPDTPLQSRPFEHRPDYPVTDFASPAFERKMSSRAARSDVAPEAYVEMIRARWATRNAVPGAIARIGALGAAKAAPMLSHDDSQAETRDFFRGHGAKISEFPMRREVAEAARTAGDWIVFGAPNAARGGSHLGSTSAGEMVAAGLCDILASDYYYPAMLQAVARLRRDGIGGLADLWKLVAENPAAASGLTDRGRIEDGRRADLVLLDWPEAGTPSPVMTLREGRTVFATRGIG
ncbi:MAG: alpha-D-ribose 1-methylphosphonate 5-triphosphate diphosphatase [Paracoccaceae bacterium]|nr:alpha-D-ribose 1-methylphosphonate 5-triphosphate diphosphatase [Paracoccaceae bacterium]